MSLELQKQREAQNAESERIVREQYLARIKIEAEEKAKIDAENKMKLEALAKEQKEKDDLAKLEKKRKFQKFLEENGFDETKDHYETKNWTTYLYRLINTYNE